MYVVDDAPTSWVNARRTSTDETARGKLLQCLTTLHVKLLLLLRVFPV